MEAVFRVLPASVIVYMLVSCGGVLRLFNDRLKYDVMAPVTCTSVVLTLFLFGTVNQLYADVCVVATLGIGIYVTAFITTSERDDKARNQLSDRKL